MLTHIYDNYVLSKIKTRALHVLQSDYMNEKGKGEG